jgi:arginyl-tRNA synthetase
MATVAQILEERLQDALQKAGIQEDEPIQVTPTAEERHGDYQTNIAMVLGKKLQQNPRAIAARIVEKLSLEEIGPPPEIAGPGFINFRLTTGFICQRLLGCVNDPRLGVDVAPAPKRLIIEFSSPNIAKPMHVGHIRSTILGDTLARVARFLGHQVITDNHLGDWGTQFGKVIYGWKNLLDKSALDSDPVGELVRIYRAADELSKRDPAVLETCRSELVKLQQGDPENLQIWQKCVVFSKQEFAKIYRRLGIHFDQQLGESFYNPQLASVVEDLLKRGVAQESEGAVVVFDPDVSETPFMVRKSDGGFGYATTDVATLEYRIQKWHPDGIWFVVGTPQQLHFAQLFSLARKLGITIDLQHIAFGSILGENRKLMRTRTGESVPLKELLDEAMTRATALVAEKNPELSAEERSAIGEIVGLGAVKYAELSQHRLTDYVFSWNKLLSLHGNTAPYLQNAYVRSRAIFRKLNEPFVLAAFIELKETSEVAVAKKILQFGEVVPSILDGFKPNVLANYLYELAAQFHAFYESCPVLTAQGVTRQSRLLLCDVFDRVLQKGLELLGIQVPERM